jgi:ribosomal protein S18 acetylase RimI-like enzyme
MTQTSAPTLHPARDEELEAIAALVNHAYRSDAGWTNESSYLGGQRTDPATLRADLQAAPLARLMTLRDAPDGPLLGSVWLEPAGEDAWYLGMLTVRPDLQDRRLGRTLLEAAEAYAAARGARRMRMTVIGVRDTLIAWYERRGYRRTGECEPFPYDDQRFGEPRREDLDFVVLAKPLGDV